MQSSEDRLLGSNFFADAIDHHPQIVAPALMLADVVKLMTQGRRQKTEHILGKRSATQSSTERHK